MDLFARTAIVGSRVAGLRFLPPRTATVFLSIPPPIACLGGRLRRIRSAASCTGMWSSIIYRQVPRQPDLTRWAPPPLLQRRRSRYLPIVRRSAVACTSRQFCGLADLLQAGRPCASRAETLLLAHPSMPRDRGARGMPSSSAFPIGSRHPDLARRPQSRSRPSFRRQP